MLYHSIKLVRFTGVPLKVRWSVETYKNKNSGLKQTNVPQGWARNSGEPVERPVFLGGNSRCIGGGGGGFCDIIRA